MLCKLKNSAELIEEFCAHELDEGQREDFLIHVYSCESCRNEIQLRQDLALTFHSQQQRMRFTGRPLFRKTIWFVTAAIIFLSIGIYTTRPKYYELANLSISEQREISPETRGSTLYQETFEKASNALLDAEQIRFNLPFLRYFDQERVSISINLLQTAYELQEDATQRNRIAYFLAKASLMSEDRSAACEWLKKLSYSSAALYREEASSMSVNLGCLGK